MPLPNKKPLYQKLIERYKELISQDKNAPERYKWIALKHFQDHFDLKAKDFSQSLRDAMAKKENLIFHRAAVFIKQAAAHDSERVRNMFRGLLNESEDLKNRFQRFQAEAVAVVEEMIESQGKPHLKDYQDERSIAFYLAMALPHNHFVYKYNVYLAYARALNESIAPVGERYIHYYQLADDFRNFLAADQELIQLSNATLTDDCYQKLSTHLITQDILFRVLIQDEDFIVPPIDSNNGKMKINFPLNQILYGPPGTGKTYRTKSLAIAIIEESSEEVINQKYPTRKEINQQYDSYLKNGQIGFVTFHQSFSYEDFIEGIKPVLPKEEDASKSTEPDSEVTNEDLRYEIVDGIFKNMAATAANYKAYIEQSPKVPFLKPPPAIDKVGFFKMSLGNTALSGDDQIYRYCLDKDCIALGWGQDIDFTEVQNRKEIKEAFAKVGGAESKYEITAVDCFRFWMKQGDIVFISEGNKKFRAAGKITGDYYFDPDSPIRYNHFRKVEWFLKDISIPVEEIYQKIFSQQTIYQMYTHLMKPDFFSQDHSTPSQRKNHVLIIDEINRGNIANIFGELITLIETDKRADGQEALSVQLPYSKTVGFSVPSNLYLIGTMNTADRSVEALDSALRRRFTFLPIYPDPDLKILNEISQELFEELDLNLLLRTINDRIEKLLDHDHTIGHAYFLGLQESTQPLKELQGIFANKILPLLREYFYSDFEKIGMVLGEGFVSTKQYSGDKKIRFGKGYRNVQYDFEEKRVFEFTPMNSWIEATFKSIYAD